MLRDIIVSDERGRSAEEGTTQRSDTDFYNLILREGRRVYGESFYFDRCVIDKQEDGTAIITFEQFEEVV